MTSLFSAAAIRMPSAASVAASAPLARGASEEPCATTPAMVAANRSWRVEIGGIIAPAVGGRRGGTDGGDRFGGARACVGSAWDGQDQARFAGGGPLRG